MRSSGIFYGIYMVFWMRPVGISFFELSFAKVRNSVFYGP